jgi:hypothetical protein
MASSDRSRVIQLLEQLEANRIRARLLNVQNGIYRVGLRMRVVHVQKCKEQDHAAHSSHTGVAVL